MKKPKICEILDVDIGEEFEIFEMRNVKFKILYDGTFVTNPANSTGSSAAILKAIENPSMVVRNPKWTKEEIERAKVIIELFGSKYPMLYRSFNGTLYLDSMDDCIEISRSAFPNVKSDSHANLGDIINYNILEVTS